VGFIGLGWIGRHRMEAIARDGWAEVVAIADASEEALAEAHEIVPEAAIVPSLDTLLGQGLDAIVIATPSALHAGQAKASLERGVAVFCQKPLARTAAEAAEVIEAAHAADRLLGVDLSYRSTRGMRCIRERVGAGELGDVYAIDLVFHNAYGPDKPWFRDVRLAGGGCVLDLGIHLVDLALWTLDFPGVASVSSRLYAGGRLLGARPAVVEDYGVAQIDFDTGCVARLACSWNAPAGRDAVIEATFHGTRGGAVFRNVEGSFYDFMAEHLCGTRRTLLEEPPDAWGGRGVIEWTRRLAADASFDPSIEHMREVAAVLDAIYGR
jgi:predicted dehydrogenase